MNKAQQLIKQCESGSDVIYDGKVYKIIKSADAFRLTTKIGQPVFGSRKTQDNLSLADLKKIADSGSFEEFNTVKYSIETAENGQFYIIKNSSPAQAYNIGMRRWEPVTNMIHGKNQNQFTLRRRDKIEDWLKEVS